MSHPPASIIPVAFGTNVAQRISGDDMVLIAGWIQWLDSGSTAQSTIRLRRYQLRAFARHYCLRHATEEDVQEYLSQPGRGPDARKSILGALRSFYRYAYARGHVDKDPTILARSIPVPQGIPKPVPEDILARALAVADEQTRFMLMLGAYAGLRRAEIARLHESSVTPHGLYITGKGGRTRRIPVHPMLAPYLAFHGWAFPSPVSRGMPVSPDYVASRVEAVLEGHTTHSLRHRFGTAVYRATRDLRATQELLGHSSPTTTARYVLLDEDVLENAVLSVA